MARLRAVAVAALPMLLPGSAEAFCSVFDGRPCAPTFCSVFDEGPCLPEIPYRFGDGLRVDVQSRSTQSPAPAARSEAPLNTLNELWAALRACWMPPPLERSRPGTQITIQFTLNRAGEIMGEPRYTYSTSSLPTEVKTAYQLAVAETLRRCTPFHLSDGLGGAIAGRPIAARFIDDRGFRGAERQDER